MNSYCQHNNCLRMDTGSNKGNMKRIITITSILLLSLTATLAQERNDRFHRTTLLSSEDSLQLAVLYCTPDSEFAPKGVLQLVHGMCEHKERYIPFMDYMAQNGWICVMHDHRGHGESVHSSSELGYFYEGGYSAMIDDVKVVNDWIRKTFPGMKIDMLGHSMGSMVVRGYAKRYDETISSLVVCGSPSYDEASKLGIQMTRRIIQRSGGLARPAKIQEMAFKEHRRKFQNEASPNAWICSDVSVVNAYDRDPLCTFQFTANGFYNLFSLMQYCYDKKGWSIQHPSMPMLFISGKDDPCIYSERQFYDAVDMMKAVGYMNVSSKLYPGMRHEILNEKGKKEVWDDVLTFIGR